MNKETTTVVVPRPGSARAKVINGVNKAFDLVEKAKKGVAVWHMNRAHRLLAE